jgi:predicted RecA/RadA family phage recombinase
MVTIGYCRRPGADQRRVLMRNFVQSGEWALTVIAPTGGVVADAIVIVGSIVGVATGTASAGAEVKIRPEGVYDLAKVPAEALAAGATAKVDPLPGSWARSERRASAGSSRRLALVGRRRGCGWCRGSLRVSSATSFQKRRFLPAIG